MFLIRLMGYPTLRIYIYVYPRDAGSGPVTLKKSLNILLIQSAKKWIQEHGSFRFTPICVTMKMSFFYVCSRIREYTESNIKTLRSPLSAQFSIHCVLSEEITITHSTKWKSNPQPSRLQPDIVPQRPQK